LAEDRLSHYIFGENDRFQTNLKKIISKTFTNFREAVMNNAFGLQISWISYKASSNDTETRIIFGLSQNPIMQKSKSMFNLWNNVIRMKISKRYQSKRSKGLLFYEERYTRPSFKWSL